MSLRMPLVLIVVHLQMLPEMSQVSITLGNLMEQLGEPKLLTQVTL